MSQQTKMQNTATTQNKHPITQFDVKKTYSFYAPIYDYVFGAILEPGRLALAEEVHLLQPSTLLEIGVGTGLLLGKYPVESKITGIDISDKMLNIAKNRAKELCHMHIQLEMMDAELLSFADNSFDCVVLPYVISVTPNPEKLTSEVRRVCKADAHIIIINHFSGSGFWWLLEKIVKNLAERIGFRSEFSYQEHVLKYNWKIIKVRPINLFKLSKLIVIINNKTASK